MKWWIFFYKLALKEIELWVKKVDIKLNKITNKINYKEKVITTKKCYFLDLIIMVLSTFE